MSILSEIQRISNAVDSIKTKITTRTGATCNNINDIDSVTDNLTLRYGVTITLNAGDRVWFTADTGESVSYQHTGSNIMRSFMVKANTVLIYGSKRYLNTTSIQPFIHEAEWYDASGGIPTVYHVSAFFIQKPCSIKTN